MYLMNYNFFLDKDTIDPTATYVPSTNGLQLTNAIYDHMTVSNNGEESYSLIPLTVWDRTTILNTNFNGNVNAGNLDYSTDDLVGVKIKRRIKGTFTWTTIFDISISSLAELTFTRYDLLNQHGVTYEYAFVPYLNDNTECAYIIEDVASELNGVFVCSANAIAKFIGEVAYDSAEVVNPVGVFEPMGSKYPVVVSNAITQYYKGSMSGVAMSFNQLMNDELNRVENTQYKNALLNFLTDKQTKIIKDWNGNLWIVAITNNPKVSYNNNIGMGMSNVSFDFVEIASSDDEEALKNNGLLNTTFTPALNPIPEFSPRPKPPVNGDIVSEIDLNDIIFTYDKNTGSLYAEGNDMIDKALLFDVQGAKGNLNLEEIIKVNGDFNLTAEGNLVANIGGVEE